MHAMLFATLIPDSLTGSPQVPRTGVNGSDFLDCLEPESFGASWDHQAREKVRMWRECEVLERTDDVCFCG